MKWLSEASIQRGAKGRAEGASRLSGGLEITFPYRFGFENCRCLRE